MCPQVRGHELAVVRVQLPSAPTALTCLTKHRRYAADKGASPSSRTSAWHTGHARCSPHQYCSANSSTNAARHAVRLPPRSRPASSRRGARHIRACVPCPPAPASPPRAWFAQCGQHKASPGRRPLRVEQARWRQALASAARSSSSAPSSARANGAISAASPPPAARAARRSVRFRSCSGSRRIEGIKKHAHRQRVLARPARALILGVPGAGATVAGSAPSAIR